MIFRKSYVMVLLVSVCAVPLKAGETVLYKYDVLGRLIQTTQSGDVNDGVITDLEYDPAGNRTDYVVAGSNGSNDGSATGATGGNTGQPPSGGGGETPPNFAVLDDTKTEGETMSFIVTKTGSVNNSYSVDYTTTPAPNSATENIDYTGVSGTFQFAAGDLQKTISVPTANDSDAEGVEIFYVDLSNPTGGATLTAAQAVGSIDDDDGGNIPPVANDDNRIMARCASSHTSLVGNDTDQDGNTPLKIVQGSLTNAPSWVTHSTTLPDSRVNIGPTPNVTATTIYTVGYTVEDTLGATDTGSLIIEVRAFGTCP